MATRHIALTAEAAPRGRVQEIRKRPGAPRRRTAYEALAVAAPIPAAAIAAAPITVDTGALFPAATWAAGGALQVLRDPQTGRAAPTVALGDAVRQVAARRASALTARRPTRLGLEGAL